MEYGGGGGGTRGGVQPPSAGARGIAGTDTTDAAWHKHEQMMLMESRHKQQLSGRTGTGGAPLYGRLVAEEPMPSAVCGGAGAAGGGAAGGVPQETPSDASTSSRPTSTSTRCFENWIAVGRNEVKCVIFGLIEAVLVILKSGNFPQDWSVLFQVILCVNIVPNVSKEHRELLSLKFCNFIFTPRILATVVRGPSTPESCISVDAGRLAMRLGASRADSVPVHGGAVSLAAGSHRLFVVS
ncbi:PREDICTED: uncharacterized protein LOC105151000 [Acromyrmex echinatior]|uniref:uncharacterized protein LOC105151000 n=1 Tax=Acromyrmex echinatior TaxID=103372 RepID=UPI000580C8C3|nr:PREDICTED: uncharacterized protein LOC105151000 [Acromyrmex echinatior]